VRRLLAAKPPRLSRPLLETLAIVAYRQPITRAEIEQLRGVDTGGVLETLVERSLIKIAGRKDAPGRPIIYATTPDFLELFGLKDLESLPDMQEFRELEAVYEPPLEVPAADDVTEQASLEHDAAEQGLPPTADAESRSDEPAQNAEPIVESAVSEEREAALDSADEPRPSQDTEPEDSQ
jgi:segregation and condensation protein B